VRIIEKLWGHEEILADRFNYCLKRLVLKPGFQSSLHYHRIKEESFYIESGICVLELSGESETLQPGDVRHIMFFQRHRFRAIGGPCLILEVSTHHDDEDVVRLEPSQKIE
jgi:mannose-6-phosphate isomerase-like protein (cupin superfamily)